MKHVNVCHINRCLWSKRKGKFLLLCCSFHENWFFIMYKQKSKIPWFSTNGLCNFFLHISFSKKYCYHRAMLTSVNLISFHFHSYSLKRKENKEDDIDIPQRFVTILEDTLMWSLEVQFSIQIFELCWSSFVENPNFEYKTSKSREEYQNYPT